MGPGFDTSPTDVDTSRTERHDTISDLRHEVNGLRESRASRAVIEQAKGVLIATTGCTADEAFQLLRTQSQHQNRRVREIAEELVARAVRGDHAPHSRHGLDVEAAAHRREGPVEES
jgi:hypothetical protein